MKNFRIYEDGQRPPEPVSITRRYAVGTRLVFRQIGDRLQAAIYIPVQFA